VQVRQGLKTFSNWKTFPQLYVKGDLVGGLDVVKVRASTCWYWSVADASTQELQESGELATMLPKPLSQDDLNAKYTGHCPILCLFSLVGQAQSTGQPEQSHAVHERYPRRAAVSSGGAPSFGGRLETTKLGSGLFVVCTAC
jgi:hypothetical protein